MKRITRAITLLLLFSLCLSMMVPLASAATVVANGSRGTTVKYIQWNLNMLGYDVGSADGICGSKTVAGIKRYQKAEKLTIDGMAGPDTQKHLWADVKEIQTLLKKHKFYSDSVDGVAGPNTVAAVIKFQKAAGLTQNGIMNAANLEKLKEWKSKNTTTTTTTGKSSTTNNSSVSWSKMKPYTDGGYSNYYVVKGYKKAYRYCQYDYGEYYSYRQGKNVGCTAVSVCMALSMAKGKTVSPRDYYKNGGWSGGGCTWKNVSGISTKNASASGKLKMIAEQLLKGRAIALWANEGHMVCVIGLKQNANLNSLKASDFLIVDPATGRVTTLNKAQSVGYVHTIYQMYYASGY